MARQVLPIVGAVVGAFFGNPQLGYMIGSIVGNAVDPQVLKGPKIGDVGVQTSRDGVPRPIVFGTVSVSGNVIDRGSYVYTTQRERQSKGGPVVESEHVALTFAIRVCEGPIEAISRIWEDEKLVYDSRPGSTITGESVKFSQNIEFFLGSESQLPAAALEVIHGVGTTPAYRGTAYVVFNLKDLTERRGSIPNYRFEVVKNASIVNGNIVALLKFNGENGSTSFEDETGRPWSGLGANAYLTIAQRKFGGTSMNSGPFPSGITTPTSADFAFGSGDWTVQAWVCPTSNTQGIILDTQQFAGDGSSITVLYAVTGKLELIYAGTSYQTGNVINLGEFSLIELSCISNVVYFFVNGTLVKTQAVLGGLLSTTKPCTIGSAVNLGSPFLGYIDTVRILKNQGLHSVSYTKPKVDFELDQLETVTDSGDILSNIVTFCCDRAGVESSEIDVSELTDTVSGFVIAGGYSCSEAIKPLQRVYFFDAAEWDSKLRFPKRGGAIVDSFTESDFIEDIEDAVREQELEFPKKLHLIYQDSDLGYAATKQTASRSSPDYRVVGEVSVEVPVVLTKDQAAQNAEKLIKTAWVDTGGQVSFKLPDNMSYLTPTDCVNLTIRGRTTRVRIEQINHVDGVLEIKSRHDRTSSYTSNAVGALAPLPFDPVSTLPGVTYFEFLNIPALVDADDRLGYYIAFCGENPAWGGCLVERSIDGGATWSTVKSTSQQSVMGELLDELPMASEFALDTTNVIRVSLYGPDEVNLESLTYAQMLQEGNACIVGDEIIQYQDAVEQSPGVWLLSNLCRSRLATASAVHPVGARFVLLESAFFVETTSALIGASLVHRATSYGNVSEDSEIHTDTWTPANSQLEFAPEFLALTRSVADVITATWVPRYRFGTSIVPIQSMNDRGFRVTITDGVDTVLLPDQTFAGFTYDASALLTPVTVQIQPINRITGKTSPFTTGSI